MVTSITTDIITRGISFRFQTGGDLLTIEETGSLTSTASFAIYSGLVANWVRLHGDVRADVAGAIYMFGASAKLDLTAGATVSSGVASSAVAAVTLSGGGAQVNNAGLITASIGGALTVAGLGAQVYNSGVMEGRSFGLFLNAEAAVLNNSGTITCSNGSFGQAAVRAWYNNAAIQNDGTIAAFGSDIAGIRIEGQASGPPRFPTVGMIENHGTISSAGGVGIVMGANLAAFQYELVNTGTVMGQFWSYLGSAGGDRILNSGAMIGDVVLGFGDDRYDGRDGTVTGRILGGFGDDVFKVSDAASVIVELQGEGRDRIEATVSFDLSTSLNIERLVLLGDAALNATGNGENNQIQGNLGANVIEGREGYDNLTGLAGADRLDGGAGEDLLSGGAGLDTLLGGSGDDRFLGGAGADVLTGGEGADVFYFNDLRESGTGKADTITDFTSGLDRINLAAIDSNAVLAGDQGFTFIGSAAFGNVAGQVRYEAGLLEVDMNGNGRAEMQIILSAAPVLLASDLSL